MLGRTTMSAYSMSPFPPLWGKVGMGGAAAPRQTRSNEGFAGRMRVAAASIWCSTTDHRAAAPPHPALPKLAALAKASQPSPTEGGRGASFGQVAPSDGLPPNKGEHFGA